MGVGVGAGLGTGVWVGAGIGDGLGAADSDGVGEVGLDLQALATKHAVRTEIPRYVRRIELPKAAAVPEHSR